MQYLQESSPVAFVMVVDGLFKSMFAAVDHQAGVALAPPPPLLAEKTAHLMHCLTFYFFGLYFLVPLIE